MTIFAARCSLGSNANDAALGDLYRFMALELTDDKAEAHDAWRDKRPPVFKGR